MENKLTREEAIEKERLDKLAKEEALAKRGKKLGTALGALGASSVALGYGMDKLSNSDFVKKRGLKQIDPSTTSKARAIGGTALAVGAGIVGYSVYKHHKNKKKRNVNSKA